MKVRELLSGPEKWTKAALARTKDGEVTGPMHKDAIAFCLAGAVLHCYYLGPPTDGGYTLSRWRRKADKILLKICNELKESTGGQDLVSWNNAQERTFSEVKELVEKLDI